MQRKIMIIEDEDSIRGFLKVNIRRLRAKIEEDSSNPTYLETVWGTGYRWRKG